MHDWLAGKGLFECSEVATMEVITPQGSDLCGGLDEVSKGLCEGGDVFDVVPVEGDKAQEVSDLLGSGGFSEVHDGLDLGWVGSSSCFGDDMAEAANTMVVEVALL